MDMLETADCFRDDLLDFLDDDDDVVFSLIPCSSPSFSELVEEEELEWISNKDAFPMVESFVDIIPNHLSISSTTSNNNNNGSQLSPISVLENNNFYFIINNQNSENNVSKNKSFLNYGRITGIFKVPRKTRSKQLRKPRKEISWENVNKQTCIRAGSRPGIGIGRKCLHCGSEKTPQWRAGPLGPKTLCNACGVRYKSGRLVPEYRPASSPTFSIELHSNSHRKIVEMRKQKMILGEPEVKPGNFN